MKKTIILLCFFATIANAQTPVGTRLDYQTSIGMNNIPNRNRIRVVGYSPNVGTTKSDLWSIGSATEYVFPTDAIQMQIQAGNANDIGSVGYSGTASGGSTTTLVDAVKNFTTLPVAVGDYIVFQFGNYVSTGIVTTVAATTLTCSEGFTYNGNPNGLSYNVIDKSAGGTGGQVMEIHYLNASYAQKQTYVILNGASAVSTTPTDIFRINDIHLIIAGKTSAGGSAVANIVLASVGGGVTYAIIAALWSSSEQAIYTIPLTSMDGSTVTKAIIMHWQAGAAKATGVPVVTCRLRTTTNELLYTPGVWQNKDIVTTQNNNIEVTFEVPVYLPPKTDMKITMVSDATGTSGSGGIIGWFE